MQKMIILMVGCPASGKSSYAKSLITQLNTMYPNEENLYKYISRDAIRFSLLKEDEQYFSVEKEVFNVFIAEIRAAIKADINYIIIDATHISKASRKKVLRELDLKDYQLTVCYLEADLKTLCERNTQREGRAVVPETAIRNMFNSYERPTYLEFSTYISNPVNIVKGGNTLHDISNV